MLGMDRISSFIKSFIREDDKELGYMYYDAVSRKIPVIKPETRELVKTQLLIKKPARILEIGTAVGYSALFMSRYAPQGATIDTIELSEERVAEAKKNIASQKKETVITIHQGDAADVLKTLKSETYDFAFVDAAKGQYIYYYPEVMRLVKKGGVIISDNVLQDGEVLESHFLVEKRNRTIHDRMREYLYTITHDDRLDTAILSVGDGVALSVKR